MPATSGFSYASAAVRATEPPWIARLGFVGCAGYVVVDDEQGLRQESLERIARRRRRELRVADWRTATLAAVAV